MTKPITILIGDDPYLLQRELTRLQKKFLDPSVADFNFDRFFAGTDPVERIVDTLNMLPMMAESRLVIVRDCEKIKKDEADSWLCYFEKPSPSTRLILVASKIDKRLNLWKGAQKIGETIELKPPYPNQLPQWIQNEARAMGIQISSEAAYALGESIGVLPMALVSNLEKLQIYISPRTKVELADVELAIGNFISKTVFDFTEKIGARDLKSAMGILDHLVEQGEPFVRLVFMIARHFRLLLLTQEGLNEGLPEPELAQQLGVHPFFVKDYLRQARKIPFDKLRQIYQKLLSTDRSLKRSPLNPRHVVNRFLMQVCL